MLYAPELDYSPASASSEDVLEPSASSAFGPCVELVLAADGLMGSPYPTPDPFTAAAPDEQTETSLNVSRQVNFSMATFADRVNQSIGTLTGEGDLPGECPERLGGANWTESDLPAEELPVVEDNQSTAGTSWGKRYSRSLDYTSVPSLVPARRPKPRWPRNAPCLRPRRTKKLRWKKWRKRCARR